MVALQKMQLNEFGIFPVPDRSGFLDDEGSVDDGVIVDDIAVSG
jgi:hypothetical protein